MSIDDEALARLRDLPLRLNDAAWDVVGSVDYPDVARLLREASEALPALLDIAEAVARAPIVKIGGADGMSAWLLKHGKHSLPQLSGQVARIVPCTGGADGI